MNPEHFLSFVRKPSRYVGNEFNVVKKDWEVADLRLVLAFPDLYEIGMSHHGLQILYHIVNSRPDLLAERAYAPDTDLERHLAEEGLSLFSLESRKPLASFDLLAITLPYELCYTNILTILSLSGLPFLAAERDESHPLVIGGGPSAFHAEPVADFFDAIFLGDGEEGIIEIADLVKEARAAEWSRQEVLIRLSGLEGVYVPSFFVPHYDERGDFAFLEPLRQDYTSVKRRVLDDLGRDGFYPPLVPVNKIVHDRLGIEVARGCTRGCRFCQAGVIYRPVRERRPEQILSLAEEGIRATGFEELALLSLSSGDYSCLAPLLRDLMDTFVPRRVSVSMPSMRVGTLTPEIMRQIKRVRKTGFTVAPEAGTDRLRRVINKGITEEDLLATCRSAFALGWKLIKFYFMFGLPTEREEDLDAICALARRALAESPRRDVRITVSVGTFVPKPHTPFQWEGQLDVEEGFARIDYLKKNLGDKRIQIRWGDPRQSFLEGVMSRGDRRLSRLIEAAWHRGARLDAWTEHFRLETWREAARQTGIDLDRYLRRRDFEQNLPWQHLDVGVEKDFFRDEYEKGLAEAYTPDCRYNGCQQCGVCDFKELRPVVWGRKKEEGVPEQAVSQAEAPDRRQETVHHHYRFEYERLERARFISHLELIQLFFRTFRRAGLPVNYSQGFNPSPRVSFSPALPLGTESLAEYLVVDVSEPLGDPEWWRARINRELPRGIRVRTVTRCERKSIPEKVETGYRIDLPGEADRDKIEVFNRCREYPVTVRRKKKERHIDARSLVTDLRADDADRGTLHLRVQSEIGRASLKPMEIVAAILALTEREIRQTRILKTEERDLK